MKTTIGAGLLACGLAMLADGALAQTLEPGRTNATH